MVLKRGAIDEIDVSESSLELITGPRIKQGKGEFRMYAMQGFSKIPDVPGDGPAFWLSRESGLNPREFDVITTDSSCSGNTVALYASFYMLAKPS